MPIWYNTQECSETSILKNLDLDVQVNDKPIKLKEKQTYKDPSHIFAKIYECDIKLLPGTSTTIKINYSLFMSSTIIHLHEIFTKVYANELESLEMGPTFGINYNYAHNMDLKLPSSFAKPLPGKTEITCNLSELLEFLQENNNILSFLQDETSGTNILDGTLDVMGVKTLEKQNNWDQEFNPLRILELQDFPKKSSDKWSYTWQDQTVNFLINAYIFILPTTITGFEEYYERTANVYAPREQREWRKKLFEIYSKAYRYHVNNQQEIASILQLLN